MPNIFCNPSFSHSGTSFWAILFTGHKSLVFRVFPFLPAFINVYAYYEDITQNITLMSLYNFLYIELLLPDYFNKYNFLMKNRTNRLLNMHFLYFLQKLQSFQQSFTVENISAITIMSIEKIRKIIREEMYVKI